MRMYSPKRVPISKLIIRLLSEPMVPQDYNINKRSSIIIEFYGPPGRYLHVCLYAQYDG